MFFSYLKNRAFPIALCALFALVYALVLLSYRQLPEAISYAALLCGVLGLCALAADYLCFRHRWIVLREGLQSLPHSLDLPPEEVSGPEAVYQDALRRLFDACRGAVTSADRTQRDMMDYCTLWAHQIKTPISAMRLLLQSQPHPMDRELTAELFKVEQYVNMVLQYLHLENGGSDLRLARYPLDDIIRQAIRNYAPLFIRSHVKLDFRPTGINVLTDQKWLCFVIEQLLSNALKYTPSGRVSIFLESPATLVIADTGIGIAQEDLPRVFEKGFTGYNGRTARKSTGIGLYLCRRVTAMLGHGIALTSQSGKGTAVRLDLSSGPQVVE